MAPTCSLKICPICRPGLYTRDALIIFDLTQQVCVWKRTEKIVTLICHYIFFGRCTAGTSHICAVSTRFSVNIQAILRQLLQPQALPPASCSAHSIMQNTHHQRIVWFLWLSLRKHSPRLFICICNSPVVPISVLLSFLGLVEFSLPVHFRFELVKREE